MLSASGLCVGVIFFFHFCLFFLSKFRNSIISQDKPRYVDYFHKREIRTQTQWVSFLSEGPFSIFRLASSISFCVGNFLFVTIVCAFLCAPCVSPCPPYAFIPLCTLLHPSPVHFPHTEFLLYDPKFLSRRMQNPCTVELGCPPTETMVWFFW